MHLTENIKLLFQRIESLYLRSGEAEKVDERCYLLFRVAQEGKIWRRLSLPLAVLRSAKCWKESGVDSHLFFDHVFHTDEVPNEESTFEVVKTESIERLLFLVFGVLTVVWARFPISDGAFRLRRAAIPS